MAIQMRRGRYDDLDFSRALPGEWLIVTGGDPGTDSGAAVYVCFATGAGERLATATELARAIEELAVTTAQIANGAVTSAKLADGAVSSSKLADGAVTAAKLQSGHVLMTSAERSKLALIATTGEVDLDQLAERTEVYWSKRTVEGVTRFVIVDASEEL